MAMLADDLAVVYGDTALSVPVVCGAASVRGLNFGWNDVQMTDTTGEIYMVRKRTVDLLASQVPSLAKDGAITVDGTAYTVHDFNHFGSGGLQVQVVLA
jgi:hypothetical protein